jgi:hypothetical protein
VNGGRLEAVVRRALIRDGNVTRPQPLRALAPRRGIDPSFSKSVRPGGGREESNDETN